MLRYPGIVHEDSDGLWIEFPGLEISGTQGENMEELVRMAEDCIGGYLELLIKEGREIPEPLNLEGDEIIYIDVPSEIAVPIIVLKERKKLGMTQNEVATKMNTSYRTLQKVERAKGSPTIRTLSKIARAIGKKLVIEFQ